MRRGRSETSSCRRAVANSGISLSIICVCVSTRELKRFRWRGSCGRLVSRRQGRAHAPLVIYHPEQDISIYIHIYIYNMVCIGKAFTRMSPGIPVPHTNNVFMCARRRNDFHSDSDPTRVLLVFCFVFFILVFLFFFTVSNPRRFPLHAGPLLAWIPI